MELQKGRPADTAGRLEKEIRTYDLLDRLGVAYETINSFKEITGFMKEIIYEEQ